MSKIAIVTDSTAYLSDEYIKEHDIKVIPLSVNFGGETKREGVDIGLREFYSMLPTMKQLPTTSQPAVGEFVKTFEELIKTHDAIIAIFLSSGLSGTFNSAQAAANMVEGNITVVDSKFTSYNLGGMVREAAALRAAGKSMEEILARVEQIIDNDAAYFVVDSLEHLHRGGRISGVSAMVGSLLQVKPIISLLDSGKLEPFDKVRTRRKALDRILELLREHMAKKPGEKVSLAVVYSDNIEDAKEFQARIKSEFPEIDPELSELGPVIGTHVGPGILAIVYYIG